MKPVASTHFTLSSSPVAKHLHLPFLSTIARHRHPRHRTQRAASDNGAARNRPNFTDRSFTGHFITVNLTPAKNAANHPLPLLIHLLSD
jgi:hypothetical protein